jgi:hypothetical protein
MGFEGLPNFFSSHPALLAGKLSFFERIKKVLAQRRRDAKVSID